MQRAGYWSVFLLISVAAHGADGAPATATLEGNGIVYVNGQRLINLTSILVGDVIQTGDAGVAQAAGLGSMLTIQSNSILRFRSDGFALDRGTISMATGKMSSVLARDFKITPVSASWSQFDVIRSSGAIQIFARKSNLTVACGSGTPIVLKEGQQLSREDGGNCGVAEGKGGAPPAVKGPILASPAAEKVGLAVGGGLVGWALFQPDDPVSPAIP